MDNKIAIITGAAGNLGRAVTQKLLDQGCHIHATLGPLDDPDFLSSPELISQSVNLTDEQETEKYINQVVEKHGKIDIAVLIVGGFAKGNLFEVSSTDIEKMIMLNFYTAFYVLNPLLKIFKEQNHGRIILIGARPGLDPHEGKVYVAYGLSKSMLIYFSELINSEFKGENITSTVIAPSTIDTPGTRKAMPDADFSKWVTPEEIAETIAFITTNAGKQLRHAVLNLYGRS